MRPFDIIVRSPNAPHLEETFSYALTGCNRVDHLVGIYREARERSGKTRGRVWTHLSDVLRAAVVLCHANLEQVLRDLLSVEAEWTPEFLQRIPLPGSKHIRADRFSLADVSRFASLPVSELLFNAVWDYLGKRSFTQVSDVAEVLDMCKLDLPKYQKFFRNSKRSWSVVTISHTPPTLKNLLEEVSRWLALSAQKPCLTGTRMYSSSS